MNFVKIVKNTPFKEHALVTASNMFRVNNANTGIKSVDVARCLLPYLLMSSCSLRQTSLGSV